VKDKETQMIDALVSAARHGHIQAAEYLLSETQEYVDGSKTRGVPLVVAASNGHVEIVRLLLEHGANVDEQDAQGQTALSSVILSENDAIIRVLIEYGASMEMVKDANLIVEARAGRIEQVESLLGSHARVNACDREGRTALIWACTNQHIDVVRSL
jgi:ankyrin repeat protein